MNGTRRHRGVFGLPWWLILAAFLGIAVTMNWEEHHAHFLGILPYLFLLSCPLLHFFMHGGHDHHQGHDGHEGHERHEDESKTGART